MSPPIARPVEFEDVECGTVNFLRKEKAAGQSVKEVQTEDIKVDCGETQTTSTVIAETQTEVDEAGGRAPPDVLDGFEDWRNIPENLVNFLLKAGADMQDELDKSGVSQAFLGYAPLDEGNEDEITLRCALKCDMTELLQGRGEGKNSSAVQELQVTGLSWSVTGSVIFASFGRHDISGWCNSIGALASWNLFRRGFAEEEDHKPDLILDHSSCLMCVSCHPQRPSLVAAGSFNGEVIVWDTAEGEEPLLATTAIDDLMHREPISRVSWVFTTKDNDYRIASVSGDGKVCPTPPPP
ncbi:unnamed protein product [Discosporangium mesarthrocarpum]